MEGLDTFAAFAATYNSLEDAEADYEAIKALYYDDGIVDTFDAAVVAKNEHGKVKIVKKHEQPLRQGAWVGGGLGLATGLCVALFPAVTLGAGLVWGTGIGAGLGALAGHAAAGIAGPTSRTSARPWMPDSARSSPSPRQRWRTASPPGSPGRPRWSARSSRRTPPRSRQTSLPPTRAVDPSASGGRRTPAPARHLVHDPQRHDHPGVREGSSR